MKEIPQGISPEVENVIAPWLEEIDKGGLVCDDSDSVESNYAHIIRHLIMQAFGGALENYPNEEQMIRFRDKAQRYLNLYGSEVMGKMSQEAREVLSLDI